MKLGGASIVTLATLALSVGVAMAQSGGGGGGSGGGGSSGTGGGSTGGGPGTSSASPGMTPRGSGTTPSLNEVPGQTNPSTSTTLADLLTPLLVAHPFSAMRALLQRWSSEQFEDGLAHGWQSRLRRRAVDSFFPALLLQGGDAGGRRRRSSPSAHDGAGLARIVPRSDRDRVLLSAVGEPARKSTAP